MLDSAKVDDIFEYVRAQTNKIDPVLDQVQRPSFVDQLVESYIADIVLFLMEQLGPKRAEQFKRTHLQIQPPAAMTQYLSANKKQLGFEEDLLNDSSKALAAAGHYATVYGNGRLGEQTKALANTRSDLVATSAGEEYGNTKTMMLPDISGSRGSGTKKRYQNSGAKSVEQSRNMMTIPLADTLGNETTQANAMTGVQSMRESVEVSTGFDTKKWKRIINGNVEMI